VVDPETLKAAVLFFTNINNWFDGTKKNNLEHGAGAYHASKVVNEAQHG
jgi:hypothetical protein